MNMKLNKKTPLLFSLPFLLLAGLSACSWFGIEGHKDAYLEARTLPNTKIPPNLDDPSFVDLMEIPKINDVRGIRGQEIDLELPEPLSTTFGVEQIVIRKLGDRRWIFLDFPPAAAWNKVRQFWEANNIGLAIIDPRKGIMETEWLVSEEGDTDQIYESLRRGRDTTSASGKLNRFRLSLEPGIRNGSTEVYMTHLASSGPGKANRLRGLKESDWPELPDNNELAGKVLTELAYYLGDNINRNSTISLMAGNLKKTRTELVPDASKPVLKYHLDFNRAWSTVGSALKSARINVEDLNRSSAVYYVYYDDGSVDEPGFLKRLFTSEDEMKPSDLEHRYQIHLDQQTGEVHVTVYKDDTTLADAFIAERLLKVIKEYSS